MPRTYTIILTDGSHWEINEGKRTATNLETKETRGVEHLEMDIEFLVIEDGPRSVTHVGTAARTIARLHANRKDL